MKALIVLTIYVAPFLLIGWAIKRWMTRKGVDLAAYRAQLGPRRRKHRAYLLGFWRDEDPEL